LELSQIYEEREIWRGYVLLANLKDAEINRVTGGDGLEETRYGKSREK
jgi:hypothetical protein